MSRHRGRDDRARCHAAVGRGGVVGDEPAADLVTAVRRAGIEIADGLAWDDAFFTAFLARVEPEITALDRPLILEDWPVPLAALARRKPDDPLTALGSRRTSAGSSSRTRSTS